MMLHECMSHTSLQLLIFNTMHLCSLLLPWWWWLNFEGKIHSNIFSFTLYLNTDLQILIFLFRDAILLYYVTQVSPVLNIQKGFWENILYTRIVSFVPENITGIKLNTYSNFLITNRCFAVWLACISSDVEHKTWTNWSYISFVTIKCTRPLSSVHS